MSGGSRLPAGGLIDRSRTLRFGFDGRDFTGHPGDTLASALLASGVRVFGRSFKYHRTRGLLAAGVEEPSALVGAGEGGRFEPNTRATDLHLYDGLVAESQNRWPSLALDVGAVNQLIAPFIPAGFYYKTFLGPPALWKLYEHVIRAAAGLGRPPHLPDPDRYERRAAFCDVLVVGAGPAGLSAALAAARSGARVALAEMDSRLGGSLLGDPAQIDGQPARDWIAASETELRTLGVRVLTRTTAIGYYDHDMVYLAERVVEPGAATGDDGIAQRMWRMRAGRVILAQGAIERPLPFEDNDRPGVMLSGAVRTYLDRFGVAAGQRIVLATSSDDAYRTAIRLCDAGVRVEALLDARSGDAIDADLLRRTRDRCPVETGVRPVRALGGAKGVTGLVAAAAGGAASFIADVIAVSGGLTPSVHLHMQAGGGLDWDEGRGIFTPTAPRQGQVSIGACAGRFGLADALSDAWRAGLDAAAATGGRPVADTPPRFEGRAFADQISAFVPAPGVNPKKVFVDPQNDVTLGDLDLAWREGYRSVEHQKRYTTLGMATDQGKTSNLIGLARLAQNEGRPAPQVGLTTFRPPFIPTTLGLWAGEDAGFHVTPLRRTPLHDQHAAFDPPWQAVGYWRRPRAYLRAGETLATAALREARMVRTTVGITDVSTLGKFEVSGPDAAQLLERVCATSVSKLAVGRGRYTFMLREDGLVNDDGTVWRLAEDRFLLTSSTGGADRMAGLISYVRNVLYPDLRVGAANVQEHHAAIAVAGPRARAVIAAVVEGMAPPRHMSLGRGVVAGVPVLVIAASYSGERAFEVYAPSHQAVAVWTALAEAAQAQDGGLYGLEALEILRVEKGHVETGGEIDGRTSAHDLRLEKMLNPRGGYVGQLAQQRPAFADPDRLQFVGVESLGGPIAEGSMLVERPGFAVQGHVTAAGLRVLEEGFVGLALLKGGRARPGDELLAWSPTRTASARVRVCEPVFHDPAGERYRD